MSVDYKKELEAAAKNMILVREPDLLIKLIVRMIVQKVKVTHAGILLHDKEKNSYILTISRGPVGLKIPAGFARIGPDNPLIRFFREGKNREILRDDAIIYDEAKTLADRSSDPGFKKILNDALPQISLFEAAVCIPSYFRKDLLGILLLGKKKDGQGFERGEIDFFIALASDVAMAIRNAQLFKELELEFEKKRRLFINTTIALATAIDAKDHYTHGHTSRVTTLSLEIAKKIIQREKKLFNDEFLEQLHIAALLHDIGKIGVPETILNKNEPLTKTEMKIMQTHPTIGAGILQPIKELSEAILGVKYHHERYDGAGYPSGLKGEQIPLTAAIISVADAYDAMTTDRPYRRRLSKEKAVTEIEHSGGTQFNPNICAALRELYKEGKV